MRCDVGRDQGLSGKSLLGDVVESCKAGKREECSVSSMRLLVLAPIGFYRGLTAR